MPNLKHGLIILNYNIFQINLRTTMLSTIYSCIWNIEINTWMKIMYGLQFKTAPVITVLYKKGDRESGRSVYLWTPAAALIVFFFFFKTSIVLPNFEIDVTPFIASYKYCLVIYKTNGGLLCNTIPGVATRADPPRALSHTTVTKNLTPLSRFSPTWSPPFSKQSVVCTVAQL